MADELMRIPLTQLSAALLARHGDNPVFRRDAGIDARGRLKKRSPVMAVHAGFIAVALATALLWPLGGWNIPLLFNLPLLLCIAIVAHPVAYRRGYLSISGERARETLDHLLATPMTSREIFEGKHDAAALPYQEARAYLWAMAFAIGAAAWRTSGDALGAIWALPCMIVLTNHIRHSSVLGSLSGISAAAERKSYMRGVLTGGGDNPLFYHAYLLARYGAYIGAGMSLLGMLSQGGGWSAGLPLLAIGAATLAALLCGADLEEYSHARRQLAARRIGEILRS